MKESELKYVENIPAMEEAVRNMIAALIDGDRASSILAKWNADRKNYWFYDIPK